MTLSHQKSSKAHAQYHSFGEVLTAGQPYAIKSLSSVITAASPPFSASRLDMYANWASASYGATTNSMSSDLRVCKVIRWGNYYRM